ncbi:MAG: aminotransferase class I/II-fold pyridoxal phosphate-dependent enzyme, partial [Proteobacteria bacterium]
KAIAGDIIYSGNITKWKKFAYTLMLRLGMRLTKVEPTLAEEWVKKAIAGGVMTDDADIAKISYANVTGGMNPKIQTSFLNGNYLNPQDVDNVEGGKYALAFASGLAANDCILHLFTPGDHVVCGDDVYGGTFRIFDKVFKPMGIEFTYVDLTNPENLEKAIRPNTKMVWMETPTNPTLKLVDIEKLAKIARAKNVISVVDNTFMSSFFQKPLALGADLVVHSVTKYMNGHSDVVGGAIVLNSDALYERLKFYQNAIGAVPAPMDCFLVMRGLKTLHLRMERHDHNGRAIATHLEKHAKIERVIYPGLTSHPQHELAKKQMTGFGGMITFYLKGGIKESRAFLESLKIFTLAESLGGVESLIEHPAIMTHASIPAETRKELGIADNMIRLSAGVEDLKDLIADLEQALKSV